MISFLAVTCLIFYYIYINFPVEETAYPAIIDFIHSMEIFCISIIAGRVSLTLNHAGRYGTRYESNQAPWTPINSTIAFSLLVTVLHYAAWVPVEISMILALPCILLPPFMYRVIHPGEKSPNPLFSLEDTCRIQDAAFGSPLIREFRQRYPQCRAYVYIYKNGRPHTSGGLMLHSNEHLPISNPTYIEVTLDCPFARKPGILVEGREILEAYLTRYHKKGTIITPLPMTNWEEWVQGMPKKEWNEYIESLDERKPSQPNRGPLPLRLNEAKMVWQPISLT